MVSRILKDIYKGEISDIKEGQSLSQISISKEDLKRRVLSKLIPKSVYISFALEFDYSTFAVANINLQDFCDRWNCWDEFGKCIIQPFEVHAVIAKLEKNELLTSQDYIQLSLNF